MKPPEETDNVMKIFETCDIEAAFEYAAQGGQALHVWRPPVDENGRACWPGERVPSCFARTKVWAHLIDHDAERLEATARRLGVRRVVISNRGRKTQHVDLCGLPLLSAIAQATPDAEPPLVRGGQGRTDEEIIASACVAAICVGGICLIGLLAWCGVIGG